MKRVYLLFAFLIVVQMSFGQSKTKSSQKKVNAPKQQTKTETPKSQSNTSSETKKVFNSGGSCFQKGDKVVELGIGFSSFGLPIHLGAEHFFTDEVSGGIALNYSSYSYGFYDESWTMIWGGAKANYHVNKILDLKTDKADLYVGATIGYWYASSSFLGVVSQSYGNKLYLGAQIGGRYFFSNKIGGFAEFGGGNVSGGIVGLSLKL